MQTECSADLFGFAPVEGRRVVARRWGSCATERAFALTRAQARENRSKSPDGREKCENP
jgi:hypothetical protein